MEKNRKSRYGWKTLNMFPTSMMNNVINSCGMDTIFFCLFFLLFSISHSFSNFNDIFIGQYGHSVSNTFCKSISLLGIRYIILSQSFSQMCWIATQPIIAGMQYPLFRLITVYKTKSNAMGHLVLSFASFKLSISPPISTSNPRPTSIFPLRFIYSIPKSIRFYKGLLAICFSNSYTFATAKSTFPFFYNRRINWKTFITLFANMVNHERIIPCPTS